MSAFVARNCKYFPETHPYLRDIRDEALLSAADECRLARAITDGDRDAQGRMIRANLRLVVSIAREFRDRGLPLEDLVAEGNLGLIRATTRFDLRFGTRFSTYAAYWIKESIRMALINTTSTIRLPAHMAGLLTKWRRAVGALTKELGTTPTRVQIAASLGLTDSQVRLIDKAQNSRCLRQTGVDAESWSSEEPEYEGAEADVGLTAEDDRKDIVRRLGRLDARERDVVRMRFGLGDKDPLTLTEIGTRLGCTREWVKRIETRALTKLSEDVAGTSASPGPEMA